MHVGFSMMAFFHGSLHFKEKVKRKLSIYIDLKDHNMQEKKHTLHTKIF